MPRSTYSRSIYKDGKTITMEYQTRSRSRDQGREHEEELESLETDSTVEQSQRRRRSSSRSRQVLSNENAPSPYKAKLKYMNLMRKQIQRYVLYSPWWRPLKWIILVLTAIGVSAYANTSIAPLPSNLKIASFTFSSARKSFNVEVRKFLKTIPSDALFPKLYLLTSINSTLTDEIPNKPAAITALVHPENVDSAICVAQRVGLIVNRLFASIIGRKIETVFYMDKAFFDSYGNNISLIHEKLDMYFKRGGRMVVVKDIETLQQETQIYLFHALCDNFLALEKRATIFFIVKLPDNSMEGYNNLAEISYNVLDSAWKDVLPEDSRPAMIARIADSVISIKGTVQCDVANR